MYYFLFDMKKCGVQQYPSLIMEAAASLFAFLSRIELQYLYTHTQQITSTVSQVVHPAVWHYVYSTILINITVATLELSCKNNMPYQTDTKMAVKQVD